MTDGVIAERMAAMAQAGPTDRVLVLGAGAGGAARRLACEARNGVVVGLDACDGNVRLARRLWVQIENLMFVLGSAEEIPWQEEYFSRVVSLEPLGGRAAREIFRVTAAQGRVCAVAEETAAAVELFSAAGFASVHIRALEDGACAVVEAVKPLVR